MNQRESRKCQNCQQEFWIEPDDFTFYEKIKVPAPTWCPDCRQQRRYAWRNERVLYRRKCDLCGKSTVTIYSSNKPFKVYCPPCWWSDKWDGLWSTGAILIFRGRFLTNFRNCSFRHRESRFSQKTALTRNIQITPTTIKTVI